MLPEGCRVQYHVYFRSKSTGTVYTLSTPKLTGNLPNTTLDKYLEGRVPMMVEYLNHQTGLDDFELMDGVDLERFLKIVHYQNDTHEVSDVNPSLRH